jgi:hypothetical protein
MTTIIEKYTRLAVRKGDVGIEIEVEGEDLPTPARYWRREQDGSLQGESAEYVLDKPVPEGEIDAALTYLDECYVGCGTEVYDSIRAGVHVHVNVQRMTGKQLATFMTAYYILENVLVRWCGDTREGNLFCLRACDAYAIVPNIAQAFISRYFTIIHDDDYRYSSMNPKPITAYGSLEFRSMRSTRDLSKVGLWAKMLLKLRDSSLKHENPVDLIYLMSGMGGEGFLDSIMGDYSKELRYDGCEVDIKSGMRVAQDLAFCTKWDGYDIGSRNPFLP